MMVHRLAFVLFPGMRWIRQAVIVAALTIVVSVTGADDQTAIPVILSLEQTSGDYDTASVFDKSIQTMPRNKAFNFVRRATRETTKERIWAYVPGKLVLLGIETDSSVSVEANMEILTGLMKEYRELVLLHTHVKRHFSCIDSENPDYLPGDNLCRSQIVENLKNAVPSPYDLSNAILAAALYSSLQPGNWNLSNFVFTPISEVQYSSTPTGIYRLKLRGARALRTKMGLIGSYSRDFPEEIVPKRVSGILSAEEMEPYVQKLVSRYEQFKEFTVRVATVNPGSEHNSYNN